MKQSCFHIIFLCLAYGNLQAQNIKPKQKGHTLFYSKTDTVRKIQGFIPSDFATCNYGFFCKQELRFEKQTHLPVRFRLGSIEYTNWLEGKSKYKP